MIHCIINELLIYFQQDVRRINHALKVYAYAHALSGLEGLSEKERLIVDLAAVLHDIGIKEAERKYSSSTGKYQEMEGPPIAKQILSEYQIEEEIIDRVCFLIGNHHSYQKIDGLDFQILVEADFIVNIFEENVGKNAIESIKKKYFKTANGIKIVETMYGIRNANF